MYTGFWIDSKEGNNMFGFDEKLEQTSIYVAPAITASIDNLSIGTKPTFREKNRQGEIIFYRGLKEFIRFNTQQPHKISNNANAVIFDNHNHALYFWYQAYKKGFFESGVKVIHIDQHTDMNINKYQLGPIEYVSENTVFNFVNYSCNVGNFIQPALQSGLIGDIELFTTEYKLLNFETTNNYLKDETYILDIDLDFWHPDMSIEYLKKTFEQTKKLIQHAQYITIATSPYFLDQQFAIALCKRLFG